MVIGWFYDCFEINVYMKYARKEKNVTGTELQKNQQMGKEKKRGEGKFY